MRSAIHLLRRRCRTSPRSTCPPTRSSSRPTSGSPKRSGSASPSTCWSATSTRWIPVDLEAFERAGGDVQTSPRGQGRDRPRPGDHRRRSWPARSASSSSGATVGASTTCSRTPCCSSPLGSPPSRSTAIFGDAAPPRGATAPRPDGYAGELVSLFALGGPARGVGTEGLRWPLEHATLEPGSTLGISNRFLADRAAVTVADGVVLVVRPGGDPLEGSGAEQG